jgi:hypothetical protein
MLRPYQIIHCISCRRYEAFAARTLQLIIIYSAIIIGSISRTVSRKRGGLLLALEEVISILLRNICEFCLAFEEVVEVFFYAFHQTFIGVGVGSLFDGGD